MADSRIRPTNSKDVTTTTDSVKGGQGILHGMFVNSTSSGTIKIEDSLAHGSGKVINNTFTPPAVGYYNLGDAAFTVGLSVTIGGTLDVTLYWQ